MWQKDFLSNYVLKDSENNYIPHGMLANSFPNMLISVFSAVDIQACELLTSSKATWSNLMDIPPSPAEVSKWKLGFWLLSGRLKQNHVGGFAVAFRDFKNLTSTWHSRNILDKHSSAAPVRVAKGERGVLRLNRAPRGKRIVLQQVFSGRFGAFLFLFPGVLIAFKLPG